MVHLFVISSVMFEILLAVDDIKITNPLSTLRPLQSHVGPWYTDLQWKAGSFCAAVREPQHTELVGSQIDGKDGIRRFPRPSVDLISEYAAWETVGYATLHV